MSEKLSLAKVLGLLLAFFGVVVPVAWDYYTSESELTLAVTSSGIVITPSIDIDGLEITYKGQSLETLSKTSFSLENTGDKPILKQDIVEAVDITFSEKIRVLDAFVESVNPKNLKPKLTHDKDNIVLSFTLLNPSDRINFSVLSTGKKFVFQAATRIVGIKSLTVKEFKEATRSNYVSLVAYIVTLISVLLALFSLIGFSRSSQERKAVKSYDSGVFETPNLDKLEDWKSWIEKTLDFVPESTRLKLLEFIETQGKATTGFNVDVIHEEVGNILHKGTGNLVAALIVMSVSLFGIYYASTSLGFGSS